MKRAVQCPGCFSVLLVELPDDDHYLECDNCGETPTVIDLRERGHYTEIRNPEAVVIAQEQWND